MARYMRSDLGPGHTFLRPPTVVTPAALPLLDQRTIRTAYKITVRRQSPAEVNRHFTRYELRPPAIVTAAAVQIFFGPSITYWAAVKSKQSSGLSRRLPFSSKLRPPAVVGGGISWHGPGVYLTRSYRRPGVGHLRPPAVVTAAQIFFGPKVYLNVMLPERRRSTVTRRSPDYDLRPPVITATNGQIKTSLVRIRRVRTDYKLSAPAVVTTPVTDVFYGPQTWLTYSRRGKPLNGLGKTPLVEQDRLGGTMVVLAPQRRPIAKYFLRNYIVAVAAAQIYYGPAVHITRGRRSKAQYVLRAPRVVFTAVELSGPEVWLTYSRRGTPTSFLRPPADTIGLEDQGRVQVHLAPSKRGQPLYRLSPPVVVFLAVEIYGPEVHLARIKPPPTISFLKPPTDVSDQQDIGLLKTHLTYSRRGTPSYFLRGFSIAAFDVYAGPKVKLVLGRRPVTKSHLSPPAVVAPVVSYGPFLWLTYSRRGEPKYFLRAPAVVSQPPAYQQVLPPVLTYSRRGRPIYFLTPPTAVFPFIARPAQVFLAPQSRGAPTSFLKPPTVLKENTPLRVHLTYSRRGAPHYILRAPVVVRLAVEIYGPVIRLAQIKPKPTTYFLKPPTDISDAQDIGILDVHLAPSRRGRPTYLLSPPVVVGRAPFRGLLVHLTYSRRGRTQAFRQPERVGAAPFRGVLVHLTRIAPRPTVTLLKPPSVVGAGVAFYGPQTWLVRIRPPKVIHALRVTLVAFRRLHGDICGFDIAGSIVCSLEVPGSQVSGSTSSRFGVSGSSRAGSTVSGSERPGGSVSGSDRKAT